MKRNGKCDGKRCNHKFVDGETFIQLITDEDSDRIYCTHDCAMTRLPQPNFFTYGKFKFHNEDNL